MQPTDVQRAAIPEVLTGANVAIQSYTGSGKTLAYLLPVITLAVQRAEEEWAHVTRKTAATAGVVQAVVVAPSRELAMQIVRVAQSLLPEGAKRAVQQCIGAAEGRWLPPLQLLECSCCRECCWPACLPSCRSISCTPTQTCLSRDKGGGGRSFSLWPWTPLLRLVLKPAAMCVHAGGQSRLLRRTGSH